MQQTDTKLLWTAGCGTLDRDSTAQAKFKLDVNKNFKLRDAANVALANMMQLPSSASWRLVLYRAHFGPLSC